MASPNTIQRRNKEQRHRGTYLGEYTTNFNCAAWYSQSVRLGWTPGRIFSSRDGRSFYQVGAAGNLIKL